MVLIERYSANLTLGQGKDLYCFFNSYFIMNSGKQEKVSSGCRHTELCSRVTTILGMNLGIYVPAAKLTSRWDSGKHTLPMCILNPVAFRAFETLSDFTLAGSIPVAQGTQFITQSIPE